jgi:chromatin assembly factor 1 subunit B
VPSIAATNSSKVVGIPITTPPETPRASFTAPAPTGTKRESAEGEPDEPSGGQPKRRRIAPTLVSGEAQTGGNSDDAKA